MLPQPIRLIFLAVPILGLTSVSIRTDQVCTQPPDLLVQQREMAAEVNLARTNPRAYAEIVEQYFARLGDDRVNRNGDTSILMNEGRPAVDEAVAFLRSAEALAPLTLNSCLSQSAQDHVAEMGPSGGTSHLSPDGRDPSGRASERVGHRVYCGENMSFGRDSPREHVIALLVDDGVESRGHRTNIFDRAYKSIGVGVGSHARFRNMTVHVMCTDELPAD
ncbi:MAG: CAP domain-containing protein [Longimicrobiaceae bacterium]